MLTFYNKKYNNYNVVNVLKSITWFKDVDEADWPVMLKFHDLQWETVKNRIIIATEDYLKQF